MAGEENTEATSAPAAPAPGGGSNKLVPILTAVNLVLTLGIAGALVYTFQQDVKQPQVGDMVAEGHETGGAGAEGEAAEGAEPPPTAQDFGKMVTLDQFTVNLSTVGSVSPKYARVNISVEVDSPDSESELTQKMPQVRNTIIDLFNSKRPSDLATPEGRGYLKEEIKNALNSFLVTGEVSGVFFTNFAVSG